MRKFLPFWLILLLIIPGCAPNDQPVLSDTAFMLDTLVSVTLYGDKNQEALDGALELCKEYDQKFNRKNEKSEIYKINHAQGSPIEISDDTREMLEIALGFSEQTNGAYDITIAPIADLWDFKTEQPKLPDPQDIEKALQSVGYQNIILSGNTVQLQNQAQIDLGSIAKGYIGDKMGDSLRAQGVKSAVIDLGGNVLTIGKKPSGAAFTVGIQKPFATRGEILGTAEVTDMAVVSSGIYERYFELDSKLYHHILDPQTGYPYQSGLQSLTIITPHSTLADALSTPVFILGLEKGMQLVESLPDVEAIFIEEDSTIHYSSGIGATIPFQLVEPNK